MSQVTLTNADGSVFFQGNMEVHDAPPKPAAFPETGSATLPLGGAFVTLQALVTTISIPDVPQTRELTVNVAGGDTSYYITVKDPSGNVCSRTPANIPGGTVAMGPAENVGPFANGGYVGVQITMPGTYTAEVSVNKLTGLETVAARINA